MTEARAFMASHGGQQILTNTTATMIGWKKIKKSRQKEERKIKKKKTKQKSDFKISDSRKQVKGEKLKMFHPNIQSIFQKMPNQSEAGIKEKYISQH